jgi:tRNA (guanine-N7-)-methyltransferase
LQNERVGRGGFLTVRRPRRLSLEELAPYLLEAPEPPRILRWTEVFGNERPVEVEVGFGKGLFLLTSAQARPDVSFLGIEISRKYQLFTATRMAKRALNSVRLVKADACLFFRSFVGASSVEAIHVYFPDPWWKKRHLKRRLFTPEFAAECERVLRRGGCLHVVTDVEEYFQVIVSLVTEHTGLRPMPSPERAMRTAELDYLTNFERKFREQGRAIYRATFERAAS